MRIFYIGLIYWDKILVNITETLRPRQSALLIPPHDIRTGVSVKLSGHPYPKAGWTSRTPPIRTRLPERDHHPAHGLNSCIPVLGRLTSIEVTSASFIGRVFSPVKGNTSMLDFCSLYFLNERRPSSTIRTARPRYLGEWYSTILTQTKSCFLSDEISPLYF